MSRENKKRKTKPLSFNKCKIFVIVHGKSELFMCKYIKSNLRIKMEIDSRSSGGSSIQINGIKDYMDSQHLISQKSFESYYEDITIDEGFKFFIIMDTDDCDKDMFEKFKNKELFKNHWLHKYITPVYNIKNLEDVLSSCGLPYCSKNKGGYIDVFPINKDKLNIEEIEMFYDYIKKASRISNLDIFIDKCLSIAKDNKVR